MAVTLEWVRDNYDNDPKNRYIDGTEVSMAVFDESRRTITPEQLQAVQQAWSNQTLLPEYGVSVVPTTNVTSFNIPSGSTLKVNGVEVI